MNCHELAEKIEKLQPEASVRDVARLCLLLSNQIDDLESLRDEELLADEWQKVGIRLQALTDQHAAMTADLEALSYTDVNQLNMDQVWVLIRAIKVQNQVVQMYVGQPQQEADL